MPKTLLLADDSVTIQKVVGISFASEDIKLVTVDNGDDALARAREVRPDIVLADVVMPGMNGYEVCEALKADPELGHVPVLLLTGTFEAFDEARARSAGADGHITKPFEAQSLVQTVKQRLAEAAEARPPAPQPAPSAASSASDDLTVVASAPPAPDPAPGDAAGTAEPASPAYDFFDEDAAAAEVASLEPELEPEPETPAPEPSIAGADDAFSFDAPPEAVHEELSVPRAAPPSPLEEPAPTIQRPEPLVNEAAEGRTTALLDPAEVRSDEPPPAETRVAFQDEPVAETRVTLDPAPIAASDDDDVAGVDLFGDEDAAEAPVFSDPGEPGDLFGDPRPGSAPADAGPAATRLDPDPGRDYDVSVSDLGAPLAAPVDPDPVELDPADFSAVAPEGDEASAPAADVEMRSPAEVPALPREELHALLERVAWDALGPVTEKIVAEAVERIEKVAWEVIPQMAEALIREEIRKLQNDE